MGENSAFTNAYFDLAVSLEDETVQIVMELKTPFETTSALPQTSSILARELPSVLNTKCFNAENLPFHEEVKNTNIAHLFEHILLQYLCDEKISMGAEQTTYEGRTRWNWEEGRDERGTFRISITMPQEDRTLLKNALPKAIELIEKLFLVQ